MIWTLGGESMDDRLCGAKTRKGTPCRRKPLSNGRCGSHGGKSTGPKDKQKHSESLKGNKNAVRTHQYETLWADQFTGKHKQMFDLAPTEAFEIVDIELRKNEVRQLLILDDLQVLRRTGDPRKVVTVTKLEEALTSVQAQKARWVEIKMKLQQLDNGDGIESEPLLGLIDVLKDMRKIRMG